MSGKSFKIIIAITIVILAMGGVTKAVQTSLNANRLKNEKESSLTTARSYKEQNLCYLALQYYRKSLNEKDTLEVRREMADTYKLALTNGEIESQQSIDDFMVETVDALWKEAAAYEYVLDYYNENSNVTMQLKILNRAIQNHISSEKIKEYYQKISRICSVSEDRYSSVSYSDNGMYCVCDGEKYGYIDASGEQILDYLFDFATPYFEGLAVQKKGEYIYLADKDGIRQKYLDNSLMDSLGQSGGIVTGRNEKGYTFYSTKQGDNFDTYDYAGKFSDRLAPVKKNDRWSIIDTTGKKVSPQDYEEIKLNNLGECVTNGVIFIKDDTWKMINTNFECVNDFSCEDVDVCSTGDLFAFKKDGKWGYADFTGKVMIEPQYEEAKAFGFDYAGVKKDGKWGFISKDNVFQMEGEYEDVLYFTESNTCFVKIDGLWTIITKLLS